MRPPPYRERSRAELRRAMRWAQRRLGLTDWTLQLCVDRQADAHPGLRGDPPVRGRLWFNHGCRDGFVGIWRDRCKDEPEDPVSAVLHEVAHVAAWPLGLDDGKARDALCEQVTCRIEGLLWELWRAEGNE